MRRSLIDGTGSFWTVRHLTGCPNGCDCPCAAREDGGPVLVPNAYAVLKREVKIHRGEIDSLHFGPCPDPFPYGYPEIGYFSAYLMKAANERGIPCTVLTRGAYPTSYVRRLEACNSYGIVISPVDEELRKGKEPGAAPTTERIEALLKLRDLGLATWACIADPENGATLEELLESLAFVDRIVVAGSNGNSSPKRVRMGTDFEGESPTLVIIGSFCLKRGIEFGIERASVSHGRKTKKSRYWRTCGRAAL